MRSAGRAVAAATTTASETGPIPGSGWGPLPPWLTGPVVRAVVAVAVFAAGLYLSTLVVRLLARPVARRFERESVASTVLRMARLAVVLGGTATAAGVLGFRISDILLSVTVFSAVLGIVLAPIVGSIINGLFVLADQPYEIGDMIELEDGTRGFVDDMTLRYTKVFTLDNTFLVIPNSRIREQQVVNYSAEDERVRLSLGLLVTYEGDLDAARELLERAARDCEEVVEGGPDIRIGVARYPASPTAYVDEYADSGVLITLRYWAKRPYKLLTVRSKVQRRLWTLLEESDAEIEIAYPHQQLVFDAEGDPAPVAVDGRPGRGVRGRGDAPSSPGPGSGPGPGPGPEGDGRER